MCTLDINPNRSACYKALKENETEPSGVFISEGKHIFLKSNFNTDFMALERVIYISYYKRKEDPFYWLIQIMCIMEKISDI